MANANLDFRHWRFYDDDSSDPDTCTASSVEDPSTPPVLSTGVQIMLRAAFLETASKNDSGGPILQYQKNGSGGYLNVGNQAGTGDPVRLYDGTPAADTACDTNLLTVDSGSFAAGLYEESTAAITTLAVSKNDSHECQWCIVLYDDGNWAENDYVEFEFAGTGIDVTNNVTARIDYDAGGPATFSRTLSDDLTLVDTISRDAVNARDLSDALTLSENLERAKIANYIISDSLSLTEQMELHFVRYRILSDALTLTENLTRDTVYTRDLLDSLSLTESLNRHAANARILADAFALTDSIARDVVNVRLLADDLTLTDSLFRDVVSAPVAGQPTYGLRRRAGRM